MAIPRLIYGFLSQSTDPYNIKIPWQSSEQDGLFRMNYSLEEAVLDNLKSWAKTNWGDRPMKFRFGLDAARFLFDPEPVAKDRILQNATEQLALYFPYLEINVMDVIFPRQDNNVQENSVVFRLECQFKDDENKKIKIEETIGA